MVRRARTTLTFTSPLHDARTATWLGMALAVTFTTCFVTGLESHLIQHPPAWFRWPPRPAGLYRVTQGVHVATGIASIPLLLAKLWTVYPHLWARPAVRDLAHGIERVSLLPLVGGSLFMLVTGTMNLARWYVFGFDFTATHYAVAWITVGALVAHIGAKATVARDALRRPARVTHVPADAPTAGLSRRGFLGAVAAGAGVLTTVTVGQTIRPLRGVSVLGPRHPDTGPQGFPVNKSAVGAGVVTAATDPAYRLVVDGRVARRLSLSLEDLRALPQHEAALPIACVEGWSVTERWRGVRVRDVLEMAGARPDASARVESLQRRSRYRTSSLSRAQVADRDTLLALEVNGAPLHLDHGYPVRLIGPNRPGVQQTKWVSRVVVR
jgi:DMSO/TMAO reductase YedYZ molybdopterin-dependent catalytic subunit